MLDFVFFQIQNKNIRIIFGYFYEDRALVAMCYAYKLNLTTDNHLWILPAWYAAGWWNRADDFDWSKYTYNCTSSDIINALDKSLLIDVYPYLVDPNQQSESGYVSLLSYLSLTVFSLYLLSNHFIVNYVIIIKIFLSNYFHRQIKHSLKNITDVVMPISI